MCRLMPFWSSVFRDPDWSLRALLPLRSPLEVAWSLYRRDWHCARLRLSALVTLRPRGRGRHPRDASSGPESGTTFSPIHARALGRVGEAWMLPGRVGRDAFLRRSTHTSRGICGTTGPAGPIPSPSCDQSTWSARPTPPCWNSSAEPQSSCAAAIGRSSRTLRDGVGIFDQAFRELQTNSGDCGHLPSPSVELPIARVVARP